MAPTCELGSHSSDASAGWICESGGPVSRPPSRYRDPMLEVIRRLDARRRMGVGAAARRRRPDRRGGRTRHRAAARAPDAARGGRRRRRYARRRRARERARPDLPVRAARRENGGCDERRRRQRGRTAARRAERDRRHASALARPRRPRRRACLLLAGGRDRCARDVSPPWAAARDARSPRGISSCGRGAVRARLRARRDAEPVHPLQRRLPLRRAARLREARGLRPSCDRALRAPRRAPRPAPAPPRRRREEGPVVHARARRPGAARPASGSRSASRTRRRRAARPQRAGLDVARRAESQEACFLAGDDYRAFLGRHGLEPRAGDVVDEDGTVLGRHDGFWRFTPGQRKGIGVSAATPLYVLDADCGGERGRRRPARVARTAACRRVGPPLRRRRPRGREAPVSLAGGRGERAMRAGGFELQLDEPAYGVARGQAAVLYDGDAVVGCGTISSVAPTKIVADACRRVHVG